MSIAQDIIWLDDLRKFHKNCYDEWRQDQRKSRDRDHGLYCKEQQNYHWQRYLDFRRKLVKIGIDMRS